MDVQAMVSVHLVGDGAGVTGPRVGSARLVHRQLVVMDSALGRDLPSTSSDAVKVRFGISGSDGIRPVVEVIDAQGGVLSLASDGGASNGIVGVALRMPSSCLPDAEFANPTGIIQGGGAGITRRLTARTSDSAAAVEIVGGDVDPDTTNWVCKMFKPPPWFCGGPQPDPDP